MSSLLEHCHGENWKSPTRSFERSGKAKRTFQGTKKERNWLAIKRFKDKDCSVSEFYGVSPKL